MDKKIFIKGSMIIKEDSLGEDIYFILSGKVKVYKMIDGQEIELAVLGPNTFFGEMSMFLHKKRTASIMAIEDTEVLVGDKSAFINAITKSPDKAIMVISTIVNRLNQAHQIISALEGQRKAFEILLTPFSEQ